MSWFWILVLCIVLDLKLTCNISWSYPLLACGISLHFSSWGHLPMSVLCIPWFQTLPKSWFPVLVTWCLHNAIWNNIVRDLSQQAWPIYSRGRYASRKQSPGFSSACYAALQSPFHHFSCYVTLGSSAYAFFRTPPHPKKKQCVTLSSGPWTKITNLELLPTATKHSNLITSHF